MPRAHVHVVMPQAWLLGETSPESDRLLFPCCLKETSTYRLNKPLRNLSSQAKITGQRYHALENACSNTLFQHRARWMAEHATPKCKLNKALKPPSQPHICPCGTHNLLRHMVARPQKPKRKGFSGACAMGRSTKRTRYSQNAMTQRAGIAVLTHLKLLRYL
eukprot:6122222-Amphidinium_carterae.1